MLYALSLLTVASALLLCVPLLLSTRIPCLLWIAENIAHWQNRSKPLSNVLSPSSLALCVRPYTEKIDVYSYGIVLVEMLKRQVYTFTSSHRPPTSLLSLSCISPISYIQDPFSEVMLTDYHDIVAYVLRVNNTTEEGKEREPRSWTREEAKWLERRWLDRESAGE